MHVTEAGELVFAEELRENVSRVKITRNVIHPSHFDRRDREMRAGQQREQGGRTNDRRP